MTRLRGPFDRHSLSFQALVEHLNALGGEASVHQLWLRTHVDPHAIDRLLQERRREHPGVVERALPTGCKSAMGLEVAERRWRLVRSA
ncbi:MAG: hypothetical protein EOO70_03420 [Myxococcaceae bacterium]|nr:MAG: hypothetical protein EOO70_03420 [Myxococcaceae bacterium]